MAVNPETGTSNFDEAVTAFEGILDSENPAEPEEQEETPEAEAEAEAESDESEEESEAEEEDAEPEAEDEETDEEIENLEQLAEATGRSVEDLMEALKTTVKVDGEASEVTLAELRAGYQKDRDYRQKTEALKREREQWETQQSDFRTQVEQQHQLAAYIVNAQEQQLAEQMNSDEMAQLKRQDEQKWLMRRYEFQEQFQRLQQTRQQAAQALEQFRSQQAQEHQQKLQETFQREREALDAALPGLNKKALSDYLSGTHGFSPEEIGQVIDHRYMMIAEKARLYDQQQAESEVTAKKVKKAPKAPKPGKQASPTKLKRSEISKLKSRASATGKVQDAAEYLLKSGQI